MTASVLEKDLMWAAQALLLKSRQIIAVSDSEVSVSDWQTLLLAFASLGGFCTISINDASLVADRIVLGVHSLHPKQA